MKGFLLYQYRMCGLHYIHMHTGVVTFVAHGRPKYVDKG